MLKIAGVERTYHKGCFKCSECQVRLTLTTYKVGWLEFFFFLLLALAMRYPRIAGLLPADAVLGGLDKCGFLFRVLLLLLLLLLCALCSARPSAPTQLIYYVSPHPRVWRAGVGLQAERRVLRQVRTEAGAEPGRDDGRARARQRGRAFEEGGWCRPRVGPCYPRPLHRRNPVRGRGSLQVRMVNEQVRGAEDTVGLPTSSVPH